MLQLTLSYLQMHCDYLLRKIESEKTKEEQKKILIRQFILYDSFVKICESNINQEYGMERFIAFVRAYYQMTKRWMVDSHEGVMVKKTVQDILEFVDLEFRLEQGCAELMEIKDIKMMYY